MANPPKKKGTGAETELLRLLNGMLWNSREFVRTAPTLPYDLCSPGGYPGPIEALATRPDRGQWLVTMRLEDFAQLISYADSFMYAAQSLKHEVHVEVKRYKKFSLHTIFESKFGRKSVQA